MHTPLNGSLQVPGDKSISHRALFMAAMASGVSTLSGVSTGLDCVASMDALRAMGVRIDIDSPEKIIVHGVGLRGLKEPKNPLNLGNSGTSMRLLAGLLAGQHFSTILTGDASLCSRPMQRIAEPLNQMGASVTTSAQGTAPIKIVGQSQLNAIDYQLPIASAQVKTCLLLAALYAEGKSTVSEAVASRDHTERLLPLFSCPLTTHDRQISLQGGTELKAVDIKIPGDFSSAAFFIVAALLVPGSAITLKNVGVNPRRTGLLKVLRDMGAEIDVMSCGEWGNEPVADIHVCYSPLHGITVADNDVVSMLDEFPIFFIAAANAMGETRVNSLAELRVKECDRLAVMVNTIQQLGGCAEMINDGIVIRGQVLDGGLVQSHGDHRVAMAGIIAGICSRKSITIDDCRNIATSYPSFSADALRLGITSVGARFNSESYSCKRT